MNILGINPRSIFTKVGLSLLGAYNRSAYAGDSYVCPLCGCNLRTFLPLPMQFMTSLEIEDRIYAASDFETLNITNYLCQGCRCSDRDRLYAIYLKGLPEEKTSNRTMIHFAPERALSDFIRRNFGFRYRTSDLLRTDVDDRADITDLRIYESGCADCFICSHVMEHVIDDSAAFAELYRILKPGGWGILMAPVLPTLAATHEDPGIITEAGRLKAFGQSDHVRVYSKANFIGKMTDAGFEVQELGADDFGPEVFSRHGISPRSRLYVVHKSGAFEAKEP